MGTLLRPHQCQERRSSHSNLRPPGRQESLNLLGKTLPIPVATAPQLRTRRQFSFNGMKYETNGLMPLTPQQQQKQKQRQQQRWRREQPQQDQFLKMSGGASGSSGELRMRGGGNSSIIDMATHESAGGDNGWRSDPKKTVPSNRMNSVRLTGMNRSNSKVQMMSPAKTKINPSSTAGISESGSRLLRTPKYPSRTKVKEELNHEMEHQDRNEDYLGKGRKQYHSQQLLQNGVNTSSAPRLSNDGGYGAKQRLMFAQSLMKTARQEVANGSGLDPPPAMVIPTTIGGGMPSKMDYITLAGLVLGCIASHALYFLCWYFSWLKNQVVGLRRRFLGHSNLWEFFDLDDTSRYSVQTKLVLAPLIIAGALLYCVVNMLHMLVQVVRSDVPRTVVVFVQRVANSGLLGTITTGLGGGGVGAFRRHR
ncbi:uncharacterized protein [Drosophila kikkawai]|uniref:Uncharacterized protein n=1 Tax=Drosophila kikkawai TaxID=30033 RepID=A0A6P4ILA4_DROKI|nr:uncharacterized protein LOC108079380 [Drosophila kikkawai]